MDLRESGIYSVLIGLLLCAINVLAGWVIAHYSFKRKFEKAIGIVMGSMVARMVIILGIAAYIIAAVPIDILAFSLAFGVGNFIFLFVEILYFHFKMG